MAISSQVRLTLTLADRENPRLMEPAEARDGGKAYQPVMAGNSCLPKGRGLLGISQ
jgi:hypothetical protein